MTSRMLELTALLEMSERIPVPPQQIIEKLEIPATDKQRWLEYIDQQEQGQSEQQEKMVELETQFKDRELKVDEQKNMLDFIHW